MVGDPHSDGVLLLVEGHARHFLRAGQDESIGAGREGLDRPELRIVDDDELSELSKGVAQEGEIVLIIEPAHLTDDVHPLLVP